MRYLLLFLISFFPVDLYAETSSNIKDQESKIAELGECAILFKEAVYSLDPDYDALEAICMDEAKKNIPLAHYVLGVIYQKGYKGDKDFTKAKHHYDKAVWLGNPDAMTNLGVMYMNGEGVEKDPKRALELFQQASEKHHFLAMRHMGAWYASRYEYVPALTWYFLAEIGQDPTVLREKNYIISQVSGDEIQRALDRAHQWLLAFPLPEKYQAAIDNVIQERKAAKSR